MGGKAPKFVVPALIRRARKRTSILVSTSAWPPGGLVEEPCPAALAAVVAGFGLGDATGPALLPLPQLDPARPVFGIGVFAGLTALLDIVVTTQRRAGPVHAACQQPRCRHGPAACHRFDQASPMVVLWTTHDKG